MRSVAEQWRSRGPSALAQEIHEFSVRHAKFMPAVMENKQTAG